MDFENRFKVFLMNIGKQDRVQYAGSIISCDADKCEQYRNLWKQHGIPYEQGIMIYLIEKMDPYNKEARVTISACDFVIKYYNYFVKYMV